MSEEIALCPNKRGNKQCWKGVKSTLWKTAGKCPVCEKQLDNPDKYGGN